MHSSDTTSFYRMRLPHWEVNRGVYFVTMHVQGSLPMEVLDSLRALSVEAERDGESKLWQLRRQAFRLIEEALDHRNDIDYLVRPEVAALCTEALRNRHQRGIWLMDEYVLMPNHIHLLFQLRARELRPTMESLKRWTTQHARPILRLRGSLWQQEWFDHWSRSNEQDERIRMYIRNNPVKAGLVKDYREWPYGSWNDPELDRATRSVSG
ncbi:MAG: transposase [Candidatus Hydrogenedentes bacterium]|nr:transposase [Candidatus Hydrogenedentota bacterium]